MEAYKFETTVLENGIIKIPEISKFENHPIEVFIVIKKPNKKTDKRAVETFLEKWTGFLKETNSNDAKSMYLNEKYK